MHVDTQSRVAGPEGLPTTATGPANSAGTEGPQVRESRRYLFSGTDSRPSAASQDAPGERQVAAEDVSNRGLFSANSFSPEFDKAYKKIQLIINSPENRHYENQLGWLSPAAERALGDLATVVDTKVNQKQASTAARLAFSITPLNPDEEAAWNGLVQQLPPVYQAYLPVCSPWREVRHTEVHAALSTDSAMAAMLDKPEGRIFLDSLVNAINSKSKDMAPTDHGMAITFRFPECYGTTAHIALAGVWFDENKQLKIGLCHQESLIYPQPDKPALGVVYDRFDTSADYPGHYAPVVEALKLAGPPSANVFPCPHPQAIVSATRDIAGFQNKRLYGPTYTWNDKQLIEKLKRAGKTPDEIAAALDKQHAEFGDKRPETCFNVTHKALAAMYYAQPADDQLLPGMIRKISSFSSVKLDEFDKLQEKSGKSVSLDQIPDLPYADQVKAFLQVGRLWGMSLPWDVPSQTTSAAITVPKRPGPLEWNLPPASRGVKFTGSTAGLKLNGKPVKASVTYTADEALQMVFDGKYDPAKKESFQAVTSMPIQTGSSSRAKL